VTLSSDVLDALGPKIHDQSINRRDIVSHPSIHSIAAGVLEVGPQL